MNAHTYSPDEIARGAPSGPIRTARSALPGAVVLSWALGAWLALMVALVVGLTLPSPGVAAPDDSTLPTCERADGGGQSLPCVWAPDSRDGAPYVVLSRDPLTMRPAVLP